jgi:hypothetical protein
MVRKFDFLSNYITVHIFQRLIFVFITALPFFILNAQTVMKRIAFLEGPYGTTDGNVICCDSDHDGLNELIFHTGRRTVPSDPKRWEVLEYRSNNQYELVFVDTGVNSPYPPGVTTGNFRPYDVGDIDSDNFIDLNGHNLDVTPDSEYNIVAMQESPNYQCYPQVLSWYYRYSANQVQSAPYYYSPDLDQDNQNEIMFLAEGNGVTYIFENCGNNQNQLVWSRYQVGAWTFAYNDFDQDGNIEFATANLGSSGIVSVYENTGPDQYTLIYQDTLHLPNGLDVFSGSDCDSDSLPEFFIGFHVVPTNTYYLYMWEATGNNTYQRSLVAQRSDGGGYYSSKCGDIDGDSFDEIIWAIGTKIVAYKATGNNQFQPIWSWDNDHGGDCTIVNVYDMNDNGYNEIVVGGAGKTSLFEMEAVRLLRPNGGETFQPDSQQRIRWSKFYPPRCDSLSLFYSTDNGRTYTLFANGISASDTSYLWTVPNVNSDSCKIKIIAYGPGWQYDESDGVFHITSTGIEENITPNLIQLSLKIIPNIVKSAPIIHYSLPAEEKVSLNLYDISGRHVKTLINEKKQLGNYSLTLNTKTLSAGVYFITLTTDEKQLIERLVVVK